MFPIQYCWKCKSKVQLRYGWCILLLKKHKHGTAGVLIYLKCWNKVRLGSYIVENAKTRYGWGFNLFEMLKRHWLGSNTVENHNIRYGWVPLLFKKQKLGTTGTLLYSKCWNKVRVQSYMFKNTEIRYG